MFFDKNSKDGESTTHVSKMAGKRKLNTKTLVEKYNILKEIEETCVSISQKHGIPK